MCGGVVVGGAHEVVTCNRCNRQSFIAHIIYLAPSTTWFEIRCGAPSQRITQNQESTTAADVHIGRKLGETKSWSQPDSTQNPQTTHYIHIHFFGRKLHRPSRAQHRAKKNVSRIESAFPKNEMPKRYTGIL